MTSFYRKISFVLLCGFLLLFAGAAAFSQESEEGEAKEVRDALTVIMFDLVSGKPMYYHMTQNSRDYIFNLFVNKLKKDGQWEPFMAELKSKGINERQAMPLIRRQFDLEMADPERAKRVAPSPELLRGVKAEECQIKVEGSHAFVQFPNAPEWRMVKEGGKWKLDMTDWFRRTGGGF
ncbi:hypothetical protein IJT93_01415 [bacterium]|nr:hypothetical protein [bacterium]